MSDVAVSTRVLSLCSGIGGLDLGVRLALGDRCRTVAYVEREAFCVENLAAKGEAGFLDDAPIWSDLSSFDGRAWRGAVDLVIGGYPCQPFSLAGNRKGVDDERHLWPHVRRILDECGAGLAFFENVEGHISLGLDLVLGDLAEMGFDAEWCCLRASEIGASHHRARLFILAYTNDGRGAKDRIASQLRSGRVEQPPSDCWDPCQIEGGEGGWHRWRFPPGPSDWEGSNWSGPEPGVDRGIDGSSDRLDRLGAIGNAVVPQQAAEAFRILIENSTK